MLAAPPAAAIPSPDALVAAAASWPWMLAGIATIGGLGAMAWVAVTRGDERRMRRLTAAALLVAALVTVALSIQTAGRLDAERLGDVATEFRCDLEAHEARAVAAASRPSITWQTLDAEALVRQSGGEHATVVRADVRLPLWQRSHPVPGFPVIAMPDLAARLRAAKGKQPVLFLVSYRKDPLQHLDAAGQSEVWDALKRYHRVVHSVVGQGSVDGHVEALDWPVVREGFLVDEAAVAFEGATTLLSPAHVADLATDGDTVLIAPYSSAWRDGAVYRDEFLARYLPDAWAEGRVLPVDYGQRGRDRALAPLLAQLEGRRFACVGYTKFDCSHFGLDFAWRALELSERADRPATFLGGTARLPDVAATLALRQTSWPHALWRGLKDREATALHHLADDPLTALLWLGLLVGILLAPLRWAEARSRRARRRVVELGDALWVRLHRNQLERAAGTRPLIETLALVVSSVLLGTLAAAALRPTDATAPLIGAAVWAGLALPAGLPRSWMAGIAYAWLLALATQLPESAAWLLLGSAIPSAVVAVLAAVVPAATLQQRLRSDWGAVRDPDRPGVLVLQPPHASPALVVFWTGRRLDGAAPGADETTAFLSARLSSEATRASGPVAAELDRLAALAGDHGLVRGPLAQLVPRPTPLTAAVLGELYAGSSVGLTRAFGWLAAARQKGRTQRATISSALDRLDIATKRRVPASAADPKALATALREFIAAFRSPLLAAAAAGNDSGASHHDDRLAGPSRGVTYVRDRFDIAAREPAEFVARWGHRRARDWELASPTWAEDPSNAALPGRPPTGGAAASVDARLREHVRDEALRALAVASAGLGPLADAWGMTRQDLCWLSLDELADLAPGDAARAATLIAARRSSELSWPAEHLPDPLTVEALSGFSSMGAPLTTGRHLGAPVSFSGTIGDDVLVSADLPPTVVERFGDSSGLLTERGGPGSHAATVARELGYPILLVPRGTGPSAGTRVAVDTDGVVREGVVREGVVREGVVREDGSAGAPASRQ